PLGGEPLREAKASDLTRRWLPVILRSRRDMPYLRGRQTLPKSSAPSVSDATLSLTRMGSRRIAA
ncbi:MAG TPA: hypothetical protein VN857_03490, partial [Chthoniobacterales bacterium]|nr:hypothetical protein [Chthoniobacterales bacterium]